MKTNAGLLAPVSPVHGFQADSSRQRICCVRRDQAEPGTRSLRLEGLLKPDQQTATGSAGWCLTLFPNVSSSCCLWIFS